MPIIVPGIQIQTINIREVRCEGESDRCRRQLYLLFYCTIINLFTTVQEMNSHRNALPKNSRYDDWLCLLCQNHNYSFRLICNRCHIQTKHQNAYMNHLYQQRLETAHNQQHLASVLAIDSFPNVLLLMINDDPWEEEQRRDAPENLNIKWINNLIEE